jgi:hypothetical protein
MAIFNSYVKLPEGSFLQQQDLIQSADRAKTEQGWALRQGMDSQMQRECW